MRYDFSRVDETESYITVPPGLYGCKITEVRPGFARDGSERWTFRLEVLDGEYAGRMAAWDSLTWSDRGVLRVKKVLEAFGFDVSGELEITPRDLQDARVQAYVQPEEWEDPRRGNRVLRNRVPFQGYMPYELETADAGPLAAGGEASVDGAAPKRDALDSGREGIDDSPF